jgi:hypothetical protein
MADQDATQTTIEKSEQRLNLGRMLRMFLIALPFIVVVVIVVLALLSQVSPATESLYSNIVGTL